ncbi:hydrogenase expression/formation protein [Helicobacter sp. CLO-3]|uniref:HyaD/HybD family hydrogenase maturation endopeptidase n=1 Tax=unclassified Helicobacter TaxID=2593540 RepID=UPI0008054D2A|nr:MULTISPECIES: HyaD/HybD family hydrogenase maturation endopeptidase [unclassified Helicobacter]OBV29238.1 hydrogenase expression/formation protein [Helicobacter sp. CLO-3]OHU83902.1 hydrogenase expression/formation protein [Helicobacter sp. CLO-3]
MKVLVLGIGNILFGDEGIGVHLCNYLKVNYAFESEQHQIEFIDGGTLAQALIPLIVEYDHILMLDSVAVEGAAIGDVYSFPFSALPEQVTWAGSAHEVEMLQTLRLTEVMGDLPPLHIVGIIPEIIGEDTSFALSRELLANVATMEKEALRYIENLGFAIKKVDSIPLQEIANHSYKGY